jgi:hypothetical protein
VFAGANDAWKSPAGRFFHGLEEAQMALLTPPARTTPVVKSRRNPIALAREWEALLANGTFQSRADLARELGVSRARVTQVLNLLSLAPQILNAIASIGDPMRSQVISEHRLRAFISLSEEEQAGALRGVGFAPALEPS